MAGPEKAPSFDNREQQERIDNLRQELDLVRELRVEYESATQAIREFIDARTEAQNLEAAHRAKHSAVRERLAEAGSRLFGGRRERTRTAGAVLAIGAVALAVFAGKGGESEFSAQPAQASEAKAKSDSAKQAEKPKKKNDKSEDDNFPADKKLRGTSLDHAVNIVKSKSAADAKANVKKIADAPEIYVSHAFGQQAHSKTANSATVSLPDAIESVALSRNADDGNVVTTWNNLHDRPLTSDLPQGVSIAEARKWILNQMANKDTHFQLVRLSMNSENAGQSSEYGLFSETTYFNNVRFLEMTLANGKRAYFKVGGGNDESIGKCWNDNQEITIERRKVITPPETQPPETKPPETKPPETQPPETKPPETKPPETKPPETQPPDKEPKPLPGPGGSGAGGGPEEGMDPENDSDETGYGPGDTVPEPDPDPAPPAPEPEPTPETTPPETVPAPARPTEPADSGGPSVPAN